MIDARIKHFLQDRFRREFSFLQARLSPVGLFGLHFTLGTAVFVGAAWLFSGIAAIKSGVSRFFEWWLLAGQINESR